jgi:hypothetical protein
MVLIPVSSVLRTNLVVNPKPPKHASKIPVSWPAMPQVFSALWGLETFPQWLKPH